MESKIKCDCGEIAKYDYLPGYSSRENSYSCEKCFHENRSEMGCSCNWECIHGEFGMQPEGVEGGDWKYVTHPGNEHFPKMTKEDGYWQYIDEKGRPFPCVEYEFSEDGFNELEEDEI